MQIVMEMMPLLMIIRKIMHDAVTFLDRSLDNDFDISIKW